MLLIMDQLISHYKTLSKKKRGHFFILSVYEWEQYKPQFESFLKKEYPDYSFENVQAYMKKLIER